MVVVYLSGQRDIDFYAGFLAPSGAVPLPQPGSCDSHFELGQNQGLFLIGNFGICPLPNSGCGSNIQLW
jgi:hypothetical protein